MVVVSWKELLWSTDRTSFSTIYSRRQERILLLFLQEEIYYLIMYWWVKKEREGWVPLHIRSSLSGVTVSLLCLPPPARINTRDLVVGSEQWKWTTQGTLYFHCSPSPYSLQKKEVVEWRWTVEVNRGRRGLGHYDSRSNPPSSS